MRFVLLEDIPGAVKGMIFNELADADKPSHATSTRLFAPMGHIVPAFSLDQIKNEKWFKELPNWPKSWKELKEISGYYVDINSEPEYCSSLIAENSNKSTFTTEKFIKHSIAEAQLSQIAKAMNGDWEPDWTEESDKYVIDRYKNNLKIGVYLYAYYPIVFKTEEMAEFSLEHHYDLWRDYWML